MLLSGIFSVIIFSLFSSLIGVCLDDAGHKRVGEGIMIGTVALFGLAVSALPFAV